jgi:hypothetical protein
MIAIGRMYASGGRSPGNMPGFFWMISSCIDEPPRGETVLCRSMRVDRANTRVRHNRSCYVRGRHFG